MTKPLIADRKRRSESAEFHRLVFQRHGYECYFCGGKATDAAHVIPRSQLGPKTRYAAPQFNGRPLCRACHEENRIFPLDMRRQAAKAINHFVDLHDLGEKCKVRLP
jgi:5-methylcytosine-specific restriction endonuclease McrA